MKTSSIHMALALALGASATAQDSPPEGHRPPPLFAAIDTDQDGVLSADEITTAAEALRDLDQNGDGEITLDELRPPRPDDEESSDDEKSTEDDEAQGPPPGKFPPPPVIAALDTDKDGTISAEELEAAPESLKELDKNDDGELTRDELRPLGPPPHMGGQRHGRRPQGPPPEEGEFEEPPF